MVPIAVGPSAHGSANLAGSMQLTELHRTSYLASPDHDVKKNERYKTAPFSGTERTPSSSSLKSSCQVAQVKVDLGQFIVAVVSFTHVNPRTCGCTLIYHVSCTLRKALATRMMCTLQLRRSSSLCVLRRVTIAYHRGGPHMIARGGRRGQETRSELRCPTSLCTAGSGLMILADL